MCFRPSADALPVCTIAGADIISPLGAPSLRVSGAGAMVGITYINHSQGCDYPGIVFLVAHNTISQTVYIATATIFLPPNLNVTVCPFIFGFPSGTLLNSTIWVISPSGVALSRSTIFRFHHAIGCDCPIGTLPCSVDRIPKPLSARSMKAFSWSVIHGIIFELHSVIGLEADADKLITNLDVDCAL